MLADDILDGVKAAADYTGLSERTILHLINKGGIPSIRKGRRRYFRKSEIDKAFTGATAKSAA